VVSLICQTLVAPDDPAFDHPTKFVGPVYNKNEAEQLARLRGWKIRPDGEFWRRVVGSPEPQSLVEMPTISKLVESGSLVVCAGGGGIPVCRDADGLLHGVEAVVDKDLTAAILAHNVGADAFLLLTDVPHVERDFGTELAHAIRTTTPKELRALDFAAGSMGPKVEAACRFVERTGKRAMIGRFEDVLDLLEGSQGTIVEPDADDAGPAR
jgi:carbamate kinase